MPPNHIRRLSLLFSFLCRMKRQSSVQQRPPTPLSLSIRHFSSASPPIQPHSAFFLASLFNCLRRVQIWSDQALSIVGKMRAWSAVLLVVAVALAAAAEASKSKPKVCNKGWECSGSIYCCNETISDYFKVYQFENLFSKRNSPVAHAVGFWDYQSFILAASLYEPLGFGTTGDKVTKMQEVAAFLGHVGSKTSCGYGVATGGPLAWGLCYNHEMSPSQDYCDPNYLYPCVDGVQYYGRGALPVYWNYNYGLLGDSIKADLLNHPEYLEQNATLAFQAAMWRWMTPIKKKQPSAHDVFVGNWKPTKNDTLSKRLPGFGLTMNILYGDLICGQGFIDPMNNIISHYQYYLDLMGIGRGNSGDNVDCAEQVVFNPSYKADTAT